MCKITDLFKESFKEIRNVRCITTAALLGAISIVLGSVRLDISEFLRVGFSFLPNQFVYYMFGPAVGGIYGAAIDILTYIVRPSGVFHPGITFSALLTGVIYGLFLYKRPLSLKRILIANTVQMVIVTLLLNNFWLTGLIGTSFFSLLPPRALKSLIMLPVETVLFYSTVKGLEAAGIKKLLSGRRM